MTRIAVTGAGGRLGSAVVDAIRTSDGWSSAPWRRPDYDLDDQDAGARLLDRDRPDLVIHAAAWTDVDGCARDPGLAIARNGVATDVLARGCAARGVGLLLVSTNEVFSGDARGGSGYREEDPVGPRNAYGTSKLCAEEAATAAFDGRDRLWIVRTAWLFGHPGNDFPAKIVAAADRLPAGEPLRVVEDEWGSPTRARDLAGAMLALVERTDGGVFHLVNGGVTSRFGWARRVLAATRPDRQVLGVPGSTWVRASSPPSWAVLDPSKAASVGIVMRHWEKAVDDELGAPCA